MKKVLSVLLIVFGLGIAVIPFFTDCLSQGLTLKLANDATVPMKCHWTAIAEVGVGVTLVVTGILSFFSKQKETARALGILGIVLGVLAILFPTILIGVCKNPEHLCNSVMGPTLILLGVLTIVASAVILIMSLKSDHTVTTATPL